MLAIKIEGLTKEYKNGWQKKVVVLNDLNLEIKKGEVFGFLGPNGAGKSTTMKLLAGLIRPSSGRAWILNEEITNVNLKKRIGFLPENPHFHPHLTAGELLSLYGALFHFSQNEVKRKIDDLLNLVGLKKVRKLLLHKFSRGMTQRIGIAQVLLNDPEVLILDEPMAGLDPQGRKLVGDIMLKLKQEGKTIFFSSHVLADAELICDRVAILVKGRLKTQGEVSQLVNQQNNGEKVSLEEVFLEEVD